MNFLNAASGRPARLLVAWLTLNLLTACSATHNQSIETAATFVPVPPKAGHSTVHIGRPFGFHTSVFALPIQVDGKPLMSLPPGRYTTVELPAGPHSVGSPNEAWTRMISGVPHPAEFVVEPGKAYYLLPKRWAKMQATRIRWSAPSLCRKEALLLTAHSRFRSPPRPRLRRQSSAI